MSPTDRFYKSALIAQKMTEARDSLRHICGDSYEDTVKPWREAVQMVADAKYGGKIMRAASAMAKTASEGLGSYAPLWVLAAALDLVEAEAP